MRTIKIRCLAILFALTYSATVHAAITGRVVDSDANPIAGASIRAYAAEGSAAMLARIVSGKVERELVASSQSAQNGSFSIDVNRSPAVDITVETPEYRWTVATVDGDDLGAIVLGLHPAHTLQITSDGKPVPGAIVLVGPNIWRSDSTGGVTAFRGPYSVVYPGYAIANSSGSSATGVKLTRGVTVRGRVVNAAGPVAGAIVSVNGWPLTETAGDGTFAIAHAPEDWKSITAVRGNEIGESARPAAGSVEIRLGTGAAFTGTIRDSARGAAVAGARMTLIGADGTWTIVMSDANGSFSFAPLLPGNYRVVGFHPTYAIETAGVAVPVVRARDFAAQPLTRVRGQVLDDEHKAISGAIVFSNDPYARTAISDAAGEFTLRFPSSPTSPAGIFASKFGHISTVSKPRIWQPGDAREDVALTLSTSFRVQVRVVDQQGQPVPNAEVNAMRLGDGVRSIVPCYSETREDCHHAGPDGMVTLVMIEGLHDLSVLGDDIAPVRLSNQMVTVRSPAIVVKVDRGLEIRGRVTYADGTPAVGVLVGMPAAFQPRSVPVAPDGTFRLTGVAAGSVTVRAFSSDRHLFSAPVTLKAPASGVTITMPRGAHIEGRILDGATRKPVNDFTILLPSRDRVSDGLAAAGGQHMHADDGRYTLDNVSPGSLQILVRASGYSAGSRNDITVEDGKTLKGIDILLDRGARVTGRVTSAGKPIAGVRVTLDPSALNQSGTRAVTDVAGLYTFESVAEGDHNIEYEKSGFGILYRPLAITVGKDSRLDVALDGGHELRGRVLDRSGRGVPDADVSALASGQPPGNTVTDDEGAFVLRGLAEGHYEVGARKAGYATAAAKLDLPQTQPLMFTLDTGATINGRVTGVPPDFTEGITVSGKVGKGGLPPPPNGSIHFSPLPLSNDRLGTGAMISADGSYTVSGLTAGDYEVQVNGPGFGLKTRYTATESGTFDVDIRGALLKGRVIDAAGGAPLANVHVLLTDSHGLPADTDSGGRFSFDGLGDGNHSLTVTRQEYAASRLPFVVSNGAVPDMEVRMEQVPATILRVVDAGTGAPVNADVMVSGMATSINESAMRFDDGAFKAWLKPGRYKAGVRAAGYPYKWVDFTVPTADVNIAIAH